MGRSSHCICSLQISRAHTPNNSTGIAPDKFKLVNEKWFMSDKLQDGSSVWFEAQKVDFDSEIRKSLEVKGNSMLLTTMKMQIEAFPSGTVMRKSISY
jgi:hypothetical protein